MLKFVSRIMVLVLLALSFPYSVLAEDHVVSTSDLQQAIQQKSQTRAQNLEQVKAFFNSEPATQALQQAKIDSSKLQQAISILSDDELQRLAAQTQKAQSDIAGGGLTTRQVTYVIIAVTAVAIAIIVAAA